MEILCEFDAASAIKVNSDVQNLITIAVAAVDLGVAILSPTPGTIASSLNTLVKAI